MSKKTNIQLDTSNKQQIFIPLGTLHSYSR